MSTWQEKAREKAEWAIHGYWCQEAVCDVCGDQFEDSAERALADAIIAALTPVVEAEVRRGQANALREAAAAVMPFDGRTREAKALTQWLRDRAATIEAGDPR